MWMCVSNSLSESQSITKAHDSDNNKTDDIIAVKFGVFELGIRMWRSEGMTHIMGGGSGWYGLVSNQALHYK